MGDFMKKEEIEEDEIIIKLENIEYYTYLRLSIDE